MTVYDNTDSEQKPLLSVKTSTGINKEKNSSGGYNSCKYLCTDCQSGCFYKSNVEGLIDQIGPDKVKVEDFKVLPSP